MVGVCFPHQSEYFVGVEAIIVKAHKAERVGTVLFCDNALLYSLRLALVNIEHEKQSLDAGK